MMLYKETNAMLCSLDNATNIFDIVVGILFGDTFVLFIFIICPDYVVWTLVDLIKKMIWY